MDPTPVRAKEWLLRAAGVVLLVVGLFAGWSRTRPGTIGAGVDFAVLHVMGVGIARGVDVYQLNDPGEKKENVAGVAYPAGAMGIVVYPPATGFAMLPFAFLPFGLAKSVWFAVINATLVLGIRALVRVVSPRSGPHAWMIAAGVVLLSAGIRWGMMLLQGAPLVLGLLCFFVATLHSGRPRLAVFIAVLVTALKMTLAVPFVGILLLHRRLRAIVLLGGAWVLLNAVGFLRMGQSAFGTYRQSAAAFEAINDANNINSPNPWSAVSLPRLDWVSLFYGLGSGLQIARVAGLACSAALALWLLREGLRARAPLSLSSTTVFLTPLVCLGSLCVYHHQYDLCLFFGPVLLTVFGAAALRKPSWAMMLATPLVLMILVLPIGTAEQIADSIMGWRGVGLVKMTFPAALTLALVGSLAVLRRSAAEEPVSAERLATASAAPPGR